MYKLSCQCRYQTALVYVFSSTWETRFHTIPSHNRRGKIHQWPLLQTQISSYKTWLLITKYALLGDPFAPLLPSHLSFSWILVFYPPSLIYNPFYLPSFLCKNIPLQGEHKFLFPLLLVFSKFVYLPYLTALVMEFALLTSHFLLVTYIAYFSTLKMVAVYSSKALLNL
jgi:hypothetical protein